MPECVAEESVCAGLPQSNSSLSFGVTGLPTAYKVIKTVEVRHTNASLQHTWNTSPINLFKKTIIN